MVCLIFHTVIIINWKNWKITAKLYFENLSIFLIKANVHTCQDSLSPCSFLFAFQGPPPSPTQRTYFLNAPFRNLQAYSEPCVILAYSQPSYIPSPGIFRTGSMFKTMWNFDQAHSGPCENSLFRHYSAVFRHIQNLLWSLHMPKPGIFGILEYTEPFHNCTPSSI